MATITQTFSTLSEGGFKQIPINIVASINDLLSKLLPNGELWIVFGAAVLIAYRIKSQTKCGMLPFILYVITFWSALRYWGVGG